MASSEVFLRSVTGISEGVLEMGGAGGEEDLVSTGKVIHGDLFG